MFNLKKIEKEDGAFWSECVDLVQDKEGILQEGDYVIFKKSILIDTNPGMVCHNESILPLCGDEGKPFVQRNETLARVAIKNLQHCNIRLEKPFFYSREYVLKKLVQFPLGEYGFVEVSL